MEKEDARYQTLEQLYERLKQVVQLHKKGIKIMQIVAMTGLSQPTVRVTIDLFDVGGWAGIRPALRRRNTGYGPVLSQIQEDVIERMIIDKRPEQLKMDLSLWTSAFGVKLRWVNSLNRNLKWCLVNGRSCKYPLQGILPLSQIKSHGGQHQSAQREVFGSKPLHLVADVQHLG
jgi:transposase